MNTTAIIRDLYASIKHQLADSEKFKGIDSPQYDYIIEEVVQATVDALVKLLVN